MSHFSLKKYIHYTFILLLLGTVLHAQVDSVYTGSPNLPQKTKKEHATWNKIKDKLVFGANFQAWLGNPTFLYLSPTVGYAPVKKFNIGIGFVYNYTSSNYGSYGKSTQSVFGGHSYMRCIITDGIFAQVQYDRLRQPDFSSPSDPRPKTWVDYVLVGGGFRQPIGDHAAITTAIMYNLTPSYLSIYYPNRIIIQFGVSAGF